MTPKRIRAIMGKINKKVYEAAHSWFEAKIEPSPSWTGYYDVQEIYKHHESMKLPERRIVGWWICGFLKGKRDYKAKLEKSEKDLEGMHEAVLQTGEAAALLLDKERKKVEELTKKLKKERGWASVGRELSKMNCTSPEED